HALEPIRRANPSRPVILCITCLNEAIPRQSHPVPYPFAEPNPPTPFPEREGGENPSPLGGGGGEGSGIAIPEPLARWIAQHHRAFAGLFDVCVPIDLTKREDGFPDPNYGGEYLKRALLDALPEAYRQTLLCLKE